jgi:hypothetical protein
MTVHALTKVVYNPILQKRNFMAGCMGWPGGWGLDPRLECLASRPVSAPASDHSLGRLRKFALRLLFTQPGPTYHTPRLSHSFSDSRQRHMDSSVCFFGLYAPSQRISPGSWIPGPGRTVCGGIGLPGMAMERTPAQSVVRDAIASLFVTSARALPGG